jgi:hypothetical protein
MQYYASLVTEISSGLLLDEIPYLALPEKIFSRTYP